ncbi:rhomboid family intramembrane serine protease [Bacillus aquiflavi]|uniref:Rhomboid family intramembrane serine protease n=1 Tax=Bacillus aquiflavi TaxID=2672567 RepID=A0A6B3W0W4_9BACI|nr:rhomboid family intramembrane serine protease [Bacillus aquiflavi]MBA4536837.1 rhomboid family intramembrane serine protease [Bacillus aquiflavi]NEY81204.1 rhomboid family intramembrane serine protease [Bacillus aquiflavi]
MFVRTESISEFFRYYPIIVSLVTIHILLYLFFNIPIFPGNLLFELMAGINLNIAEGELWRFITPIFVHGSFPHMLFNSFSLVLFGPVLERQLGKGRFISLYLLSGILANVATFILKPFTYVHVGASGAIFGLFGFYIAMIAFRKNSLSRQDKDVILTITAIGFIMTFITANINVTAHIFGFIGGFLFGTMSLKK